MTYVVTAALALAWVACWALLGRLDNELEADMDLRDRIRAYLNTDRLPRMEQNMADWLTTLNGLVQQTTAASAAQATSFSNLQGAIGRQTADIAELRRLLEQAGEVTPEMQALAAQIGQSLDDMKKAAETADNGFEPVEEVPTDVPGDGVPPTDGQPPVDAPVEPVTDVPAEQAENNARRR
uniref:hypothetical protein n=1 Tax=Paractinoplanes polyasparticus TaxID=2856853 RepID=UPI001C853D45|nr:hypothetical protein [Actinoplanes polyasparticus]